MEWSIRLTIVSTPRCTKETLTTKTTNELNTLKYSVKTVDISTYETFIIKKYLIDLAKSSATMTLTTMSIDVDKIRRTQQSLSLVRMKSGGIYANRSRHYGNCLIDLWLTNQRTISMNQQKTNCASNDITTADFC